MRVSYGLAVIMGISLLLVIAGCGASEPVEPTLTSEQVASLAQTAVVVQAQQTAEREATRVVEINITATALAGLSPEERAVAGVNQNSDWTPVEQEFDDVEMVLVPVGCFIMGTTDEEFQAVLSNFFLNSNHISDEQPAYRQCVREPFWMDKYEVSNGQFRAFNGVAEKNSDQSGTNFPRDNVTWAEARDFCALRGGRLPTEREWEYASRGPDRLIFTWGNEFVAQNIAYLQRDSIQIGSFPDGASWVGALDMLGNVSEWVSSLNLPYPYESGQAEANSNGSRIHRGGNYLTGIEDSLRTANRDWLSASTAAPSLGFRCVRDFTQ